MPKLSQNYLINLELRDLVIEKLGILQKENVLLQQSLREQKAKTISETENLFLELLEIADALEALLEYLENNANPNREFIERLPRSIGAVNRKFLGILAKREVFPIQLEIGTEPDFNFCCVLDREETTDVADQTITKIVRRGFKYQEKVIRPTEVITAKSPLSSPLQALTENIETDS